MADKKSPEGMTTVGLDNADASGNNNGNAAGNAAGRIRINDKEYNVNDLPEEAKQLLMQIRATDQELMRHQALVSMLHTARQACGARLEQLLNQ